MTGNRPREIPVAVAKQIAAVYGYGCVVIYARKIGVVHAITTAGIDPEHKDCARRVRALIEHDVVHEKDKPKPNG